MHGTSDSCDATTTRPLSLPGGRRRVVVAMSGGVDSSVAAALLVEEGHEVIGVSMKTHASAPKSSRACCTPDDMRDARRVADALKIPHYTLAYEEVFAREVVRPFVAAYRAGLTPNPCIACNDRVKFRPLLARARLLGADYLATGHYARVAKDADGTVHLLRGVDVAKDQSYFLYRLAQEQLQALCFPLGAMDKPTVRAHARRLKLELADKAESQDICFVGAAGYAEVVGQFAGCKAGMPKEADGPNAPAFIAPVAPVENVLVDMAGRVVGRHPGVHHFTVGQRRGIGPGLARASAEPLFVAHIDAARGRITVGPRAALDTQEVEVGDLRWTACAPKPGAEVQVQQRHRERPKWAHVVEVTGERLRLRFVAATLRGAPGQAAVLYDGALVLGGGVLRATSMSPAPNVTTAAEDQAPTPAPA